MKQPTASSVARALKRAGILTVPSRAREGVYVTGSGVSRAVHVSVTIDAPSAARRMSEDVAEVLTEAGYAVERTTETAMYVRRNTDA